MPKLLRYHSRIAEDLDFKNSYGNGFIKEEIETNGLFYYFYGDEYYYAIICSDYDEDYGFSDIKRIRYQLEIPLENFTKEIGNYNDTKDKILILNKFEDYASFFWIFSDSGKIDYKKVEKYYGGVEFRNTDNLEDELMKRGFRHLYKNKFWLSGFDNGGGIIWNLSLVKEFVEKSKGSN